MLTHRVHLNDPPAVVPHSGWAYTDAIGTAIRLTTGNFVTNDIYEFSYIAKDPTVNGLGFAAIRDFNSFLRYSTRRRFRHTESARRLRRPDLHGNLVPARPDAQRLRPSRLQ